MTARIVHYSTTLHELPPGRLSEFLSEDKIPGFVSTNDRSGIPVHFIQKKSDKFYRTYPEEFTCEGQGDTREEAVARAEGQLLDVTENLVQACREIGIRSVEVHRFIRRDFETQEITSPMSPRGSSYYTYGHFALLALQSADALSDETRNRFGFHKLDKKGVADMKSIRSKTLDLAEQIELLCPDGDLRKLALDHLQHVMTSANLAIAQSYPLDPEST